MVDIKKQLDFFKSLSDAYHIENIRQAVDNLQEKAEDKSLYLAVVGEFSSGKSTFINALIGRRILKEAVMPTTACATYIAKGTVEIEIGVIFDKKKFHVYERDLTTLNTYIRKKYNISISGTQHLIDILTSEQSVASDVKALFLSIPNISIPDNIVIIDTPGFNPGDLSVKNHFEVTKDVVENHADAALVLMPSDQPFSNSVKVFLQNHLHKYLHRCVYVLTMGDHKSNNERIELLDFVKNRLKRDFKLEEPKVYCESAITTLPVVKIPENMKVDWGMWQSEFKSFKQYVWNLLTHQKELIISEHLHNLVLDISKEMQNSLLVKQVELEEQKKRIDKSRVSHIDSLTTQLALKAKNNITNTITKTKDKLDAEIRTRKSACLSFARTKLTRSNAFKFHQEVEPLIASDAKIRSSNALLKVNELISTIVKVSVDTNIAEMQKEFTRHYSMFPTLQMKDKGIEMKINKIKLPEIEFSSTNQIVSETNEKGGGNIIGGVAGGAAAGATIGSIVPIIGTGFGALVGGIAGFFFGGSQIDELRNDAYPSVKSSMEREIDNYFNSVKTKIKDKLSDRKQQIDKAIDDYSKKHVTEYGDAVERLILQQEHDSKIAQDNINSLKNHIRSLEDIEHETKYNLVRLKEQK